MPPASWHVSRNPSDQRRTGTDGSYFRLDRRPHAGSGQFLAAFGRLSSIWPHMPTVIPSFGCNPPMGSARNDDMQGFTQLMLLEAATIRRSSARSRRTSFTEWRPRHLEDVATDSRIRFCETITSPADPTDECQELAQCGNSTLPITNPPAAIARPRQQ